MPKRKQAQPKDMPVMRAMCESCPFNPNNEDDPLMLEIQQSVISRLRGASQLCRSTGHPIATHLCRGARDWQLTIFYRLGWISEPTDEAWAQKMREAHP